MSHVLYPVKPEMLYVVKYLDSENVFVRILYVHKIGGITLVLCGI
jgi:hypothetical protein